MNRTRKGNYYRTRTKKWLVREGYDVVVTEVTQRVTRKDRETGELSTIFIKHDLWGADLLAINDERIVAVQVKANAGDISRGLKELAGAPWSRSRSVEMWCVHWPARRLMTQGPDVHEVQEEIPF